MDIHDNSELAEALWAGDVDKLQELAPCGCCCDEHTFESCPARLWEGCRGQGSITRADLEGWAQHYGMTMDQFYGNETPWNDPEKQP